MWKRRHVSSQKEGHKVENWWWYSLARSWNAASAHSRYILPYRGVLESYQLKRPTNQVLDATEENCIHQRPREVLDSGMIVETGDAEWETDFMHKFARSYFLSWENLINLSQSRQNQVQHLWDRVHSAGLQSKVVWLSINRIRRYIELRMLVSHVILSTLSSYVSTLEARLSCNMQCQI